MTITRDDVLKWIRVYAASIAENRAHLTELDAAIGDGDHGINMHRGFEAVKTKLASVMDQDIGTVFKTIGMTLVSTVGGASGPLYGTFFLQMGKRTSGKLELTPADWIVTLEAGVDGVVMRGKAQLGDKTMIDCLVPALQASKKSLENGSDLGDILRISAKAAEDGMLSTIPLVARKGRASYLGERSAGHQDPGATSANLLIKAAADAWS